MPNNSRAHVVCLLAERYDTKSNVKLGGFQSQLQAYYMSSYSEEMWYNETVSLWIYICVCVYIVIHRLLLVLYVYLHLLSRRWQNFCMQMPRQTSTHCRYCNKEVRNVCVYIYIYCHPQTDCFVLSELFSVARHAGRSKPGSKPVQLYVRLSFRPLGHQADHFG